MTNTLKSQVEDPMKYSELRRLCIVNSDKIPSTVNIGGRKQRWVGIGLVDEGEADGTEVEIIDG